MERTERDVTKLPKWAQMEIQRLQRNLASAEERLSVGPDGSDTFANPYYDTPQPLGRGTTVEFRFGPNSKIRVRLDHTSRGPCLDVNGDDGISIEPGAANSIRIRI